MSIDCMYEVYVEIHTFLSPLPLGIVIPSHTSNFPRLVLGGFESWAWEVNRPC